ncbi:putative effector protein [Blumeria hordei DH14]|uniref:Putative effector protein n=1 Tax=Blumeria graminis f. sp. hordei (strain DH14) TaxID=546991 RepID=N1JID1_BLUG1|nr:putative effector protein [Blumeria hordei DH14]
MRLLGLLTVVFFHFSVHVAGDGGYLCLDADGKSNTTYDQTLVEKSVTDACLSDSELSAAELQLISRLNSILNSVTNEYTEEPGVLIFTNRDCVVLGLLQISEEEYLVCKAENEHQDEKSTANTLPKKPRPGSFYGKIDKDKDKDAGYDTDGYSNDGYESWQNGHVFPSIADYGETPETAVPYHERGSSEYDQNGHARLVNNGQRDLRELPQFFRIGRDTEYIEYPQPPPSHNYRSLRQASIISDGYVQGSSSEHASLPPTWGSSTASSSGEGSSQPPRAQAPYFEGNHYGVRNYRENNNFNSYGQPDTSDDEDEKDKKMKKKSLWWG